MNTVGVDLTANISLQKNVHNKGFVVDSKIAVVSSQNFSPAGIEENRDAGVILENADVAQYFETVFLADWNTKAKPFAPTSRRPVKTNPAKKRGLPKRGTVKKKRPAKR